MTNPYFCIQMRSCRFLWYHKNGATDMTDFSGVLVLLCCCCGVVLSPQYPSGDFEMETVTVRYGRIILVSPSLTVPILKILLRSPWDRRSCPRGHWPLEFAPTQRQTKTLSHRSWASEQTSPPSRSRNLGITISIFLLQSYPPPPKRKTKVASEGEN